MKKWDVMGDAVGLRAIEAETPEAAAEKFVRWIAGMAMDCVIEESTQRVSVRPAGKDEPTLWFDTDAVLEVTRVIVTPARPDHVA